MLSQYMHKFMEQQVELVGVGLKEKALVHLLRLLCRPEQYGPCTLEDKAPLQSVVSRIVVASMGAELVIKERVVGARATSERATLPAVEH
jgi:hypothetical protein